MTDINCPNENKMFTENSTTLFEDIKVYVPNQLQKYCINAWGGYLPPELPISKQYPHEGRISFTVPKWMKDKYPFLYIIKNNIGISVHLIVDQYHVGIQ